jgi:hypothetical protein
LDELVEAGYEALGHEAVETGPDTLVAALLDALAR